MINVYWPVSTVNGSPITATKGGVPKPLPDDLVLSSNNPAIVFVNHGTWTRISRGSTSIPTGGTLIATIKARSESLNIEDTAQVVFHGPEPDHPDALDIDEPSYVPDTN